MKKILLLAALSFLFTSGAHAQNAYASNSGMGVNGFRSVSEENAYMEQVMTERRKKYREESGWGEEAKQAPVKHENNQLADNRKKQPAKMKK